MRVRILTVVTLLAVLVGLVGVVPVAAQDPPPVVPDPIDIGAAIRKGGFALSGAPSAPVLGRRAATADYEVGDVIYIPCE